MGSYNSFYIDAEVTGKASVLNQIESYLRIENMDEAWRKWSAQSKWWAFDQMKDLSAAFPGIIFSCHSSGETPMQKMFYLDGMEVPEYWALPKRWPTKPAMRLGKQKADKYWAQRKIEEENAAIIKAEGDRLAKIAKLEADLKQLKTG